MSSSVSSKAVLIGIGVFSTSLFLFSKMTFLSYYFQQTGWRETIYNASENKNLRISGNNRYTLL